MDVGARITASMARALHEHDHGGSEPCAECVERAGVARRALTMWVAGEDPVDRRAQDDLRASGA